MKFIGLFFVFILFSLSSHAELDVPDQKALLKAKKLFEKGELYKSIDKLKELLKTNPRESELYSLMIHYQVIRYEKEVNTHSGDDADLKNMMSLAVRGVYYEDMVKLLKAADANCDEVFYLCVNIDKIIKLGLEKSYATKNEQTYYQVYQQEIDLVKKNKCK
ncbi:MAG: hypothetical protein HRT71_17315 [Flavobacteriales bacterium]|nr:hypothetical protein [Flavobacteriales bacterium]